jgi:pSer/pThr/pTyr-binding forkhead associated (FHA) protein
MAYLVFSTHKGKEFGRRRLERPITIGRSPECDISLHDIQLSRRHCRLERTRQGWVVSDLGSKNGTVIDGRVVTRHVLRAGEVIEIGRVKVTFRAGKLAPAEERKEKLTRPARPADPFNASAGTVAGFKYEPPAGERSFDHFPSPKPVLSDSGRFVAEGVSPDGGAAASAATDRAAHYRSGDSTIAATPVPRAARPKTPNGDTVAPPQEVISAAPLPAPPRAPLRLRLKMLVHSLQRGIRRPLARWAALLT